MVGFDYPKTVDQAIDKLISVLPLKDRVYYAGLAEGDLASIDAERHKERRWHGDPSQRRWKNACC